MKFSCNLIGIHGNNLNSINLDAIELLHMTVGDRIIIQIFNHAGTMKDIDLLYISVDELIYCGQNIKFYRHKIL